MLVSFCLSPALRLFDANKLFPFLYSLYPETLAVCLLHTTWLCFYEKEVLSVLKHIPACCCPWDTPFYAF